MGRKEGNTIIVEINVGMDSTVTELGKERYILVSRR